MTEKDNSTNTDRSFAKSSFVTKGQVRLLYMQAPISNSSVIIISFLFYFILQPRFNSNLPLLWLIMLLVTASYRMYLWHSQKNQPEVRSTASWLNCYLIGCGLVGVSWSLIYQFLYGTDDPFIFASLLMLAFGVISSAIPILSACIPAFILYTYPQGLMVIITLLRFEDKAYCWLAVAVGLYMVMITLFIRNINRSILQSIRLEEQNFTLIENLNDEISQREILISQRTLELNEINTDLDATLRAIPDLLFELDEKGTYLDLWAHDVDLLIAEKSALLGQTVTEMFPAEAAQVVMAGIHEAEKTGASHGQVIKLPLKQGVHWFELSTSRKQLTDDSNHYLMLARDITDKHQMEAELLKVRKLESVGVLAGGIAHDFNNILSAILGNIELATYRVEKDTKAVSLLSDAQKATKRAAKLTQQLLTFSRGGHPVKEATSLAELISETTDFVLHGSQVSCDYTFQDDLWMADVDSGQISQVIQNIILNAIHAMPEGGRINVRCENVEDKASESLLSRHEGNFVRIAIRDTGIGIPQEVVDRIFDPYFTTKQEGSGLGLAICYSVIKKHDGHITVQSSPDKGTLFTLYLPAKHSSNFTVAKQQKLQPAVKRARVMVMDDEEMIREIAQKQLSILGHDTVLVADGEEAIYKYQKLQASCTPIDLVIMDLTIPGGMGGQEASKKLLQVDPATKIIVASGYSNDPLMANYRKFGFSAAIAKPFDLSRLRKAIEDSLV